MPTPLEVAKSSIVAPIVFSVFVTTNTALLQFGLAFSPIIAPIFFGQQTLEVSIHDADFKEKNGVLFSKAFAMDKAHERAY
jgi:hypothetical protein